MRPWPDGVPEAWRARAGDVVGIVLALVLGGLATEATDVATTSYAEANELIGLGAALALWWGRRAPVKVAAVTFAAAAVAPMAAGASVLGVFVVAAHHRGRIPVPLFVLGAVSGVAGTVAFPDQQMGAVASLALGVLLTLAALGWGLVVRSRRELVASLAERAERAESDQRARIAEARRAERTRIATEMHDALAHRLSMLSLQAGAVELRPTSAPEDLARAAAVVRSSAHLALEELRTVIGVLRQADLAEAGSEPDTLPTVTDIAALVEESRSAGTRIDVVDGSLRDMALPPDLARHVYRIVQEGLTNARKHAPGAPVRLAVTGQPGEGVSVDITNAVRNVAGATYPGAIPGAGVGLVGVQERVELLGGKLERGTDDAGNHRLRAWMPWPA